MTREEMSCEISVFLDEHPISELLDVVACRVADEEDEAESKRSEKIASWVDGRCNHCGHKAPSTSVPEMGGYSITVPDLSDYCPGCGYKMEKE